MMFDHPMGMGLHRKPSRVESAKRFWRVSPILSDGNELLPVCVCESEIRCFVCSVTNVKPVGEYKVSHNSARSFGNKWRCTYVAKQCIRELWIRSKRDVFALDLRLIGV